MSRQFLFLSVLFGILSVPAAQADPFGYRPEALKNSAGKICTRGTEYETHGPGQMEVVPHCDNLAEEGYHRLTGETLDPSDPLIQDALRATEEHPQEKTLAAEAYVPSPPLSGLAQKVVPDGLIYDSEQGVCLVAPQASSAN